MYVDLNVKYYRKKKIFFSSEFIDYAIFIRGHGSNYLSTQTCYTCLVVVDQVLFVFNSVNLKKPAMSCADRGSIRELFHVDRDLTRSFFSFIDCRLCLANERLRSIRISIHLYSRSAYTWIYILISPWKNVDIICFVDLRLHFTCLFSLAKFFFHYSSRKKPSCPRLTAL